MPRTLGSLRGATLIALLISCQARKPDRAPSAQGPAQETASIAKPTPASPAPPLEGRPTSKPGPPTPKLETGRIYRVAALGDSITDEEVGGGTYLQHLRTICPKSHFYHFGKGGDMTNQMRRRLTTDLLPKRRELNLDTLIVLGGVNDLYSNITAGRTNERIEADLEKIYQTAHQNELRVVAVTVLPWGGFSKYYSKERGENTRALNSFILGLEPRKLVDVAVDGYSILSCGEPERLCPAFELPRPDGLHPGPEGHKVLGTYLKTRAFSDCL